MNKKLRKIIEENPLGLGSVHMNVQESIEYINSNVSLNVQEKLVNLYEDAKKAKLRDIAQDLGRCWSIEELTYAKAVHRLRKEASENQPRYVLADGSSIPRPLTFKETVLANMRLGHRNFTPDTCTGIAYKSNSSLVKISPETEALIIIPKDYFETFIPIDYETFEGEEIDAAKSNKRDLWLIAMGGVNRENEEIYAEYVSNLCGRSASSRDSAMTFDASDDTQRDVLRNLKFEKEYSEVRGSFFIYGAELLKVD